MAKKNIFACLLFLFSIWIDKTPHILALVLPFDAYLGPLHHKDEELGLWRVGMKPRASVELIFVKSIIWGAILIVNRKSGKENEYFVMDLIDADMFLHCKEMWGVE